MYEQEKEREGEKVHTCNKINYTGVLCRTTMVEEIGLQEGEE